MNDLDQLRIDCAKAMGWTQVPPENFTKFPAVTWPVFEKDGKRASIFTDSLPDYPGDANAALTLCDALAKEGWTQIFWRVASGQWSVVFDLGAEAQSIGFGLSTATAETLPIAICRAFLAVREANG